MLHRDSCSKNGRRTKMERKALYRLLALTVLVMALVGLNAPAVATDRDDDRDDDHKPRIARIDAKPQGQTYGRWAAEWWQWVLGIPFAVNPLLDMTGEHCAQRQVDEVWFLAGSFVGPVVRDCEIPKGKSLFFPLINNFFGAELDDPPDTRTEEFVRAAGSCTEPAEISVEIDGFKVRKPTRFFTGPSGSQSPFFNVQLPPGNLVGAVPVPVSGLPDEIVVPELVLTPSAEQGYYLFVRPLSPGTHTIRWIASGCTPDNVQDITYNLTVVDGDPKHHH
jgi:hypothetical protein